MEKESFKYYFVLLRLTMESITIKVESELAKEIEKEMKPYYSTKTEFIREAIRDKIKSLKTARDLRSYFGKAKAKTTYAQERKIREEVGKEFAKKFGIELE
mgnify:CR=1 FL=1